MSEHILKRHNKTLLLYHLACPAKYRRKVFSVQVEKTLRETCLEISKRYEFSMGEISMASHFLRVKDLTDFPTMLVPFDKKGMEKFFLALAKSLEDKIFE